MNDRMVTFQHWIYRLDGFLAFNPLEDPAWLAMIFC
jgi:hypothetical protein